MASSGYREQYSAELSGAGELARIIWLDWRGHAVSGWQAGVSSDCLHPFTGIAIDHAQLIRR